MELTLSQMEQIKKLKKELLDLKQRIKYECWDCMGRQSRSGLDCHCPTCPLYDVRPKTLWRYHPPPKKYGTF